MKETKAGAKAEKPYKNTIYQTGPPDFVSLLSHSIKDHLPWSNWTAPLPHQSLVKENVPWTYLQTI